MKVKEGAALTKLLPFLFRVPFVFIRGASFSEDPVDHRTPLARGGAVDKS